LIPKTNVNLEHLRPKATFADNTTSMKYYYDEKQGNNEEFYASSKEYVRIKDINKRS
jgi:protein tyrosine/serine phosphatase